MNNLLWIYRAANKWANSSVNMLTGISRDKISAFEGLLDFKFPDDFISLYRVVNGFSDYDWNEQMISLWSLERIAKEYQESTEKSFVGFCDYSICSHEIGFLKTKPGIYKSYDTEQPIAASFREAITLINSNSDLIY